MTGEASSIGGVPLYTAEESGPTRAVLAFRVGRADEPLAFGGMTHLVEHLALLPFRDQPYRYGAQVEGALTLFWVQGSEGQVVEFLGRLCQNLDALPLDRLVDEARLLQTEAASRKLSPVQSLLTTRYGPRGWGSVGYPEYGLRRVDPERIAAWADRWFTAGNAALGATGAIAGASLPLKQGPRMPPPELTPVALQTPAWLHETLPGIAVGILGPRTPRFATLMQLCARRGRDRLRFTDSLSYDVGTAILRLGPDLMHATLWADGTAENMSRVWSGLLEVMDQLMSDGPSRKELGDEVESFRGDVGQPGFALSILDGRLRGDLFGAPPPSVEQRLAQMEASTPDDYAALLREVFPTMIAALPPSVAVLDRRFFAVPEWSSERLQAGRQYELMTPRSVAQGGLVRLTVGEEGVSLTLTASGVVTVRYRECAAALAWDDGSRTLRSFDSFRIHVRPADWKDGGGLTAEIDRHLTSDLLVPAGARPNPDPDALSETGPAARQGTAGKSRSRAARPRSWRQALPVFGVAFLVYLIVELVSVLHR